MPVYTNAERKQVRVDTLPIGSCFRYALGSTAKDARPKMLLDIGKTFVLVKYRDREYLHPVAIARSHFVIPISHKEFDSRI